jgi:uncharacterized protein
MLAHELFVTPAVTRALERYQVSLERAFGDRLREFVLYGSQARGTAHEESDVDVLVVVDDLTEDEHRLAVDLAYDANAAEREIWVGVSPLVRSTTAMNDLRDRERLITRNIARDGIWLVGVPEPTAMDGHQ